MTLIHINFQFHVSRYLQDMLSLQMEHSTHHHLIHCFFYLNVSSVGDTICPGLRKDLANPEPGVQRDSPCSHILMKR